jgi:hypothetical protein
MKNWKVIVAYLVSIEVIAETKERAEQVAIEKSQFEMKVLDPEPVIQSIDEIPMPDNISWVDY